MKFYMIKIEAGGKWHRFGVLAETALMAMGKCAELAELPHNAHIGHRYAKAGEDLPTPSKERMKELAALGWTCELRGNRAPK
jgi:hypothetical protein